MSATRTPSIRSVSAVCISAPRADCPSRNARITSHRPPKAAAVQKQPDPEPAEDHGEALAELGGSPRAAALVAGRPPDDRARDPAAVERERGHEVEQQHDDVHQQQPAQRQQHRRDPDVRRQPDRVPQQMRTDDREIDTRGTRSPSRTSRPARAAAIRNSSPGVRRLARHLREARRTGTAGCCAPRCRCGARPRRGRARARSATRRTAARSPPSSGTRRRRSCAASTRNDGDSHRITRNRVRNQPRVDADPDSEHVQQLD